jgi:hypothetical protein
MMNYQQMEVVAQDQQHRFLAAAEQQRLLRLLPPSPSHPVVVWIGQQFIKWGKHLQGKGQAEGQVAAFHNIPAMFTR